jgi:uncharacterized membrane protein YeaQ/YmgE (transglycosylase-associated protein family)
MLNIIIDLFVGAFAGWLAAKLMGLDSSNWIINCVLGLCGGLIFGLIAGLFGISATNIIGSLIFAVVGACLLVWLYNKFIKK